MKAITLYQPWATWIAWGWKTIETRCHAQFIRLIGQRLFVHAGQTFDYDALNTAGPFMTPDNRSRAWHAQYPRGVIVATARVADARWLRPSDSPAALYPCDASRFGLFLEDIAETPHVPIAGQRGMWELPDDLAAYPL